MVQEEHTWSADLYYFGRWEGGGRVVQSLDSCCTRIENGDVETQRKWGMVYGTLVY